MSEKNVFVSSYLLSLVSSVYMQVTDNANIKVSGSYWTVFLHGIAHSTSSATEIHSTSEIPNYQGKVSIHLI